MKRKKQTYQLLLVHPNMADSNAEAQHLRTKKSPVKFTVPEAVFRIRIHRVRVFFGLPDPDPLPRGRDPDPALDPDPDPSIIKKI
jgi:hypothetical protein